MRDYILNRNEQGMVRYLYKNDGKHPFVGYCKWESARWMLENDKSRELWMSEEYEGFPLTADGVYFFDGCLQVLADVSGETNEAEGDTSFVSASADTFPSEGKAFGKAADIAPVCGQDWCEIPELAEKPRRKKRIKDVACE